RRASPRCPWTPGAGGSAAGDRAALGHAGAAAARAGRPDTLAHGARRPRSIRAVRARALATTAADLARGAPGAADVRLESVGEVQSVGDDAADDCSLPLARQQVTDLVELVRGNQLQDLDAYFAVRPARQIMGQLDAFRRFRAALGARDEIAQRA